MPETLQHSFQERFGPGEVPRLYFAPGRINLIGEHIDYNGGYVLPTTIDRGLWAAARSRADRRIRMAALAFPEQGIVEYDLDALPPLPQKQWSDYPLGMLQVMREAGYGIERGWELLVTGDLPIANGLSSSHALMILSGLVLTDLFALPLRDEAGRTVLAQLSQRCENEHIGVQSGIMDGFSIALGQRQQALLLKCDDLSYQRIEMRMPEAELWVIDSMTPRELSASAYNQRFQECQEALRRVQRTGGAIAHLADLDEAELLRYRDAIADPLLWRRARHVVSENARTLQAAVLLQEGRMREFGELLNASHRSLRDDYHVTGEALDTLAELCGQQAACLGARMTGAGFGGCFIALFRAGEAEAALREVAAAYGQRLQKRLDCFPYRGGLAERLS